MAIQLSTFSVTYGEIPATTPLPSTSHISKIVEFSLTDIKRMNELLLCPQDREIATKSWTFLHSKLPKVNILNIIKDCLPDSFPHNPVKVELSKSNTYNWGSDRKRIGSIKATEYYADGGDNGRSYEYNAPCLEETESWARSQPDRRISCLDHLKYVLNIQKYQPTAEGPNYTLIGRNADYLRLTIAVCLREKCELPCLAEPNGRMLIVLNKKTGKILGDEISAHYSPAIKVVSGCPSTSGQSTKINAHCIYEKFLADVSIETALSGRISIREPKLHAILYPPFNPRTCGALHATYLNYQSLISQNSPSNSTKCVIL